MPLKVLLQNAAHRPVEYNIVHPKTKQKITSVYSSVVPAKIIELLFYFPPKIAVQTFVKVRIYKKFKNNKICF